VLDGVLESRTAISGKFEWHVLLGRSEVVTRTNTVQDAKIKARGFACGMVFLCLELGCDASVFALLIEVLKFGMYTNTVPDANSTISRIRVWDGVLALLGA
jgi:hypothetical protein